MAKKKTAKKKAAKKPTPADQYRARKAARTRAQKKAAPKKVAKKPVAKKGKKKAAKKKRDRQQFGADVAQPQAGAGPEQVGYHGGGTVAREAQREQIRQRRAEARMALGEGAGTADDPVKVRGR